LGDLNSGKIVIAAALAYEVLEAGQPSPGDSGGQHGSIVGLAVLIERAMPP
jgi:hypothetical protein